MIDTHAHLNEIEDIDRAILRAEEVGIKGIVAVGMDMLSNQRTLDLASKFPEMVYPAIGYHPWSINQETKEQNLKFIERNLSTCIALGEVGIDYKTKVKKSLQWEIFSSLLSIALRYKRPVIVHSRFSHKRSHEMVLNAGIEKAVFHWYSGPLDILAKIIDQGYYVSATPALAYSPPHQAAMRAAPLERILVETDSPVEYEGRISEPAHLMITLEELSRLKGIPFKDVQLVTSNNARLFFGI
jgi:TatD DNase family protein